MSPTYPNFCGNFEQTLFDTAGNSLPKHIQKASFFLILHNGIISLGSEKFTGDISYDYIYIQCLKLISVDLSSGRPLSEGVMVSEGVPVHCIDYYVIIYFIAYTFLTLKRNYISDNGSLLQVMPAVH